MSKSFTGRKRVRKNFGRIPVVVPMPNLIEVQKTPMTSFFSLRFRETEVCGGVTRSFQFCFSNKGLFWQGDSFFRVCSL